MLLELYELVQAGNKAPVRDCIERFYSDALHVLPSLMVSIFIDERVIDRYDVLNHSLPAELRGKMQSLVFSNPYTTAWSTEIRSGSSKKRITDDWRGGSYLARIPANFSGNIETVRGVFETEAARLGLTRELIEELGAVRDMVLCSEELHYLWGSVTTLLSTALTRLARDGVNLETNT